MRRNLSGNSDSDFPLPSQQPILKRQKPVPDGGELTLNFHEKGVGIFINVEVTPIGVLRANRDKVLGPFSTTKSKEKGVAYRLQTARKSHKGASINLEKK